MHTVPLELAGSVAFALVSALGLLWRQLQAKDREVRSLNEALLKERDARLEEARQGAQALRESNRALRDAYEALTRTRTRSSSRPPGTSGSGATHP